MDDTPTVAGTSPASRAAFGFIFASALAAAGALSLIIPILPNMVRQYAGGDPARAAEWMSLFVVSFGLAQFVCSPILGMLSDRFGRRPVLILANLGLAADYLFMAFAPGLAWLLVGRIIGGMTAANFATCNAYVADVTPPERRAKAFGLMGSALAFGFMAGPALGGILGEIDLRLPFVVAAVLTLANAVYGLFVLPESLPRERRSSRLDWSRATPLGSLRLLRSHAELAPLAGISFLNNVANMIWGSVWVLYCAHRWGWTPVAMGLQVMLSGVLALAVQSLLVGPIVARLGDRGALIFGAAAAMLAFAYAGWAPTGWIFVIGMPASALALVMGPALESMLTKRVGPDEQGRLQGATKSLSGISAVIGPPIFGAVFAWSLRQETGHDLSGLACYLAAAIMAACVLLAVRSRR